MTTRDTRKLPWMKFYPADWRADPALRMCSLAARGLWMEMLSIMHEADPRGSLRTNVSNATVRCLSNMKLAEMLENRHAMSQAVRHEVSPKSDEWGYKLGSIYIRKVHFRDANMMKQIEEKVVNRLRQVTSAIKQDGANQVSIIASTAERQAAIEFGKAQAMRPQIVGEALKQIAADPEVLQALFEVLEGERVRTGHSKIILIPDQTSLLAQLIAARQP